MKRYPSNIAAIGTLALFISIGGSVAYGLGGENICTICAGCPDGLTVCFPGTTPVSACRDLGCSSGTGTLDECGTGNASDCPTTEAGQCDDGVNNDAWKNSQTDCDDHACATDPVCLVGVVVTIPPDLNARDEYRLLFVTNSATDATSADIAGNNGVAPQVFLHYSLDGSGATANGFVFLDDSGNDNHGTLVDLGTPDNTGFVDSPAAFSQAWNDPGQNDDDRIDLTTPFNPGGAQPWAIAFWHDMSGGVSMPLFDSASSSNTFLVRADAARVALLKIAGQATIEWNTTGIITQNGFHHYAIVADPTGIDGVDLDGDGNDDNVALYVDGAPVIPNQGQNLHQYGTAVFMDSFHDGSSSSGSAFTNGHGVSDELWVFEQTLTQTMIEGLMSCNSILDGDGDGVPDACDVCPGFNDNLDADADGVPNDCDTCPNSPNAQNITRGTVHATIQGAINAAGSGDVIELGACTFFEDNLTIPDGVQLTLQGAGMDQTFIDGGSDDAVRVFFLSNSGQTSDTVIADLTISTSGGTSAVRLDNTSPTFRRVRFFQCTNQAVDDRGGATYDRCVFTQCGGFQTFFKGGGSTSVLLQCLFSDNETALEVIVDTGGPATLVNCTFDAANALKVRTGNQGDVFNTVSTGVFVVTGDGVINITRSVYPGATGDNIDGVATFVDAPGGDYRLAPGSLGIDAADNVAYLTAGGGDTDLNGDPRTHDDVGTPDTGSGPPSYLDMGAYEFQGTTVPGDCNGDGKADLGDYADFADCLLGPGGGLGVDCDCFDSNNDGDVALADFGGVQLGFTGK